MPVSGSRPEWEKENNRTQIIFTLLEKSLTFTELLNETGLARSTLSNHLKELQEQQIIEKAIENGRVVYRTMLNEKVLVSELKRVSFDWFLKLISLENPDVVLLIETIIRLITKYVIVVKRRVLEGKPQLPLDFDEMAQFLWSESTQEEKEIIARSNMLLQRFGKLIEPELQKMIARGIIKEGSS